MQGDIRLHPPRQCRRSLAHQGSRIVVHLEATRAREALQGIGQWLRRLRQRHGGGLGERRHAQGDGKRDEAKGKELHVVGRPLGKHRPVRTPRKDSLEAFQGPVSVAVLRGGTQAMQPGCICKCKLIS
ncbi:hypothetical protein [Pseudomonas sp. SORGH_AS_0211]|uniref:hypothetical protein n=1 Tax=Pseudomonas sp. SORGH_AS_0211 TaxID=3041796 RepID=UPI0038621203